MLSQIEGGHFSAGQPTRYLPRTHPRRRPGGQRRTADHPTPRFAAAILSGAYRQYSGHRAAPIGRPRSTHNSRSSELTRSASVAPKLPFGVASRRSDRSGNGRQNGFGTRRERGVTSARPPRLLKVVLRFIPIHRTRLCATAKGAEG
jgi:hypothetical protein